MTNPENKLEENKDYFFGKNRQPTISTFEPEESDTKDTISKFRVKSLKRKNSTWNKSKIDHEQLRKEIRHMSRFSKIRHVIWDELERLGYKMVKKRSHKTRYINE